MNHLAINRTAGDQKFRWQADESLRRAGELIENCPGLRAVSFDFFDTLVWRLAARPTDVFSETARRLRHAGLLPDHVSDQGYEVLRRHAEAMARQQQGRCDKNREDITLEEIVAQLKSVIPQPGVAAKTELGVEADFCLLNPVMAGFARHARQRGLKVLIISDIYLSADQLRGILRANHFDPAFFNGIFTSSDAGVCKWSSKLFARVLQYQGLKPEEMLHIGDNYHADVVGARKAGVRGCHYVQGTNESSVILEREKFLLGSQSPVASVNSLRLLAGRNFPGDTDENYFGRAGAILLGPLLTRYASWACEQLVAAGVRKVGAFMREGELLGQMLRREASAKGYPLEIAPLYVNRKSTDLAAIGELTATNLMDWVGRRQTLQLKAILEHFGLRAAELRQLPFAPDETINSRERLLQVGKFLFAPAIAERIKQRSAAERRKIMDYLGPWLDSGGVFGVCDIGYNATAQMQLKRIFEMEGCSAKMVGCYLVTCETAAQRMLDGLDVRHFLGAFGYPAFNNFAFLRAPAFVEQSLVAECGTTLGYERTSGGAVRPVLDEMRFPPELLRRQRAFKEGVLHYQDLWLHFREQKPALLDGSTELSRRLLADIDLNCAPVLARVTAFPTQNELSHFASLPLDDYYFAEGFKTISGAKEREVVRTKGFAAALNDQGVLWPQAANQQLNPKAASDFFSYAKAMLLCQSGHDNDGVQPALSVIISASHPDQLRRLLGELVPKARAGLGREVVVLIEDGDKKCCAVVEEFTGIRPLHIVMRTAQQTTAQQFNQAVDHAGAPLVLFLDDAAQLSDGWDQAILAAFDACTGAVLAAPDASCLAMRRQAIVETLGFAEGISSLASHWRMLLGLRELGWQIKSCSSLAAYPVPQKISANDQRVLACLFPDYEEAVANITAKRNTTAAKPDLHVVVSWEGSFLDHGSLSHVNRELTGALKDFYGLQIKHVANGGPIAPEAATVWPQLASAMSTMPAPDSVVTVRHAWPPNWTRPRQGKLVVIQPWEFGSLPESWVQQSCDVDEFWIPSNYVRRVYIESGVPAEKVFVMPNGVDAEKFYPNVPPMKLATQRKFKFLFVGGTIGRKGPDILLQAYLKNFTAADDVCLVIKDFGGRNVYQGQTFEAQIRAAQSLPNAPEILYINEELSPELLPGIYTACDCFVMPYRGEGFGLPVLEAMACGLPVVVTAGGATDDFVRDEFAYRIPATKKVFGREVGGMKLVGNGWLLEPTPGVLGEKMRHVFNHPAEARDRGQLASRYAHENFSWKKSAAIAAERLRQLTLATSARAKTIANPAPVKLPEVAHIGQLAEARELLGQKKLEAAWAAAVAAIARRPFHPEAFLLLAEIALAAGAGRTARLCAQRAREFAPDWSPARQFLARPLKGDAKPDWLQLSTILNPPSSPRLSVCLIVKNEERFLAQCLKSVRGVATQIIVVDTGSSDRTVEIAREFGAEIYSFAWCDDFAAARNAALEHATGDWVLMLDADEELPATQHAKLSADMKDSRSVAFRLPLVNAGQENEGRSFVPRLFRNTPGAYFTGRIHEQVFASLLESAKKWGLNTSLGTAELLHHGYSKDLVRDRNKIERNLKLLRSAIEENPTDVNLLMNLGLELVRSEDLSAGIEKYREAFSLMSGQPAADQVPELREVLLTQFTSHLYKVHSHEEVVRILNSPLAQHSGLTASLHFALGLVHFELKQFGEAADQMRQCLAKRKQPCLTPINTDILTAAPQHCLALCLARLGEVADAEKAFVAALAESGSVETARLDYARFLYNENHPVDALNQLHGVVTANARNAAAWRLGGEIALSRAEFLEFALDWTAESFRALPENPVIAAQRAEALMLNNKAMEAAPLWKQIWTSEHEPRTLAALVLCEVATSQAPPVPNAGADEQATSRAFVEWYQKLIAARAKALIEIINGRLEPLSQALPSAAEMLRNALSEADAPVEV